MAILSLRKDNGLSCQTITQESSQTLLRLLKRLRKQLEYFLTAQRGTHWSINKDNDCSD